ncbi:MAG TPA: thermonuclease family protein [Burkholderiaceae bacterium]|nr:thermonuclease family protein [Burkholderiaceae bacterium]
MVLIRCIAVCAFVASTSSAVAVELDGTIVGVADGDTVTLLDTSRTQHRIRLDGIDAPERTQPHGQRSRQSLAALAHGRIAHADCPKVDRYGRAVCRVIVEGVDVGLEQIRRGYAWHYVKYAREQRAIDRERYARAESDARQTHSGLWSFSDPVPPWDYRRTSRGG